MWTNLKIEEITECKLKEEFPNEIGKILYGDYAKVKCNLCENILDDIKAKMPDHTDHGQRHIENVLRNAQELLGDAINKLRGIDLYCLLMSILFHDTGNFFDRKNHQNNIEEIYCFARPSNEDYRMEQILITKIVQAHCGIAPDNTKDTVQFVDEKLLHDINKYVNCRELAALVRFADELAEGKQRTSSFRLQKGDYSEYSKIFNQYASVTKIKIDRKLERIALTYQIDVEKLEEIKDLRDLLEFIYERIIKLDQERRYAKHYCNWLLPFKQTSVSFNFWAAANLLELGLDTLSLTDLVVPGEENKKIDQYNSDYKITSLINKIADILEKKKNETPKKEN
jgi:HD superfamily phosphodiesterase